MYSIRGFSALILTTIFWSSSFPVIKIVIGSIGGFGYTWLRSVIALLGLSPYAIYKLRKGFENEIAWGGLITGIAYGLGLWLQGWGTGITTASNSAFITGLNVMFVHLYAALVEKRYSFRLGVELILAITGLYLLTSPRGGFNLGDLLVLLGSIAWASQVILVSKYGGKDPILFTFFEMSPALLFILPDLIDDGLELPSFSSLLGVTYLGLVCSDVAFILQAYGQRYILPEIAAIIFLLEPILASIFSWIMLGEVLISLQILGAALIMCSIAMASVYKK